MKMKDNNSLLDKAKRGKLNPLEALFSMTASDKCPIREGEDKSDRKTSDQ